MNSGYEENLDENFSKAISLCESEYSKADLVNFLKNGNIAERQFAALELSSIDSKEDAFILISNLTGCDGKIREAVSYKISELIVNTKKYFIDFPEIFADATIDINANICRTIIETLFYFKNDEVFAKTYLNKILFFINEALEKLDSFNFRDKKYTINKQLFKIYWCLEGINVFFSYADAEDLYLILKKCSKIEEYTIREKVALVLKNELTMNEMKELKKILTQDENYYVKNV